LKQGNFSDQGLEFFIVFHPPSDLYLPSSGHIQREGFAIFLPGEIKDRMLCPSLMASAILLTTATGGRDEATFDPGIQGSDLVDKLASLGFECPMCCLHICIVLLQYGNVKKKIRTSLEVLISVC
jgi:hypothetical protein